MNRIFSSLILFSFGILQYTLNASDSGADILGQCIVSPKDNVKCEGVKLTVGENALLECGTSNNISDEEIGMFSVSKVIDENNNKIIPHVIAGNLIVNKNGIFISKCDDDTLSNTIKFSPTSNIQTDSFNEFSETYNNTTSNCMILNGQSYYEKQNGNSIIIFEPKAKVNGIRENNKGQIYGGIIDLTPYVRIDRVNNKPQLSLDKYNGKQVTREDGQLINAHIKNAFIELFIQEDIDNVKEELILDPDIDPIDNKTNSNKILFNKIKFTQCVSEIPGSGSYSGYGIEKQIIKTKSSEPDYLKYCGSDNTDVVKRLFDGNLNPVITSDVLVKEYNLYFKNIGNYKLFAELFKKYINYNCYIQTNDTENYKLSETISDEVEQNGIRYHISSEHPLEQVSISLDDNIKIPNTNPQEYIDRETSQYIQVRGENIHNIELTSEKDNRTLHVYNEWIEFGGIIKLNNISNLMQEYYPINKKYHGYSVRLQSNKDVHYIFKKNGIINLNYLPVNNNAVNFTLKSINIVAGQDKRNKNKVRCNKHDKAHDTTILVNTIALEKNTALKFLCGTSLIIGNNDL